jgi:hypothetical protein
MRVLPPYKTCETKEPKDQNSDDDGQSSHCLFQLVNAVLFGFVQGTFRVPIFPTDPNKAEDWPSRPGTLTDQGLEQHYLLGQYLRQRYTKEQNFLNPCYNQKEIYVKSTDFDRTIRSALANMAGMYPPCSQWNPTLAWTPVTVHSSEGKSDTLMTPWVNCPRLMRGVDEIFETDEDIKQFQKTNERLLQFIKQESGWQDDFRSMWKVGDCLKSERENNLTWASWVNETIYDLLIDIEILNFKVYSFNETMKKFSSGNMLREIASNMRKMLKAEEPHTSEGAAVEKMRIYSGHDTTVIGLMAAMEIWPFKKVNYASYVKFELLTDNTDKSHYVKVYVRDDEDYKSFNPQAQNLTFCGKKSLCPLDEFQAFTDRFLIQDWDTECSLDETKEHRIDKLEQTVTALTVVVTILIFGLFCFTGFVWWKYTHRVDLPLDSSQMTLQT